MPSFLDLVGRQFGRLKVVRLGEPEFSDSGKSRYKTWVCECACGRVEAIREHRLPYCASNKARTDVVEACSDCRAQRTCVVCSATFQSIQSKACCSDACWTIHSREVHRNFYYARIARDPDHNKKRHATLGERARSDPDLAARLASYDQAAREKKKRRLKIDDEYREHVNARSREQYAQVATRVQEQRRERQSKKLDAMTPGEYEAWAQRRRTYSRLYAQKRRSTPEGRARYQQYMREYLRQQALRKLVSTGDELIRRSLDNE